MSKPVHHPPDELLVEYASGGSTEGEALLVAVHCTLCPDCRKRVEMLDAVGEALLDEVEEAPLAPDAEARLLAALDDGPATLDPRPVDPDGVFPAALVELVGPAADLTWRLKVPGIRTVEVPVAHGEQPVQLYKLSPGLRVPRHEHEGIERTLVLTGGFSDNAGQYGRGDVAIYGEDWLHDQVIDPGEPCIALVVNDHPLIPKTLLGKLVRALVGA